MTTPANITDWLLHPANFSDNDRKSAAAILKAYPYLVPARYLEAAEHQKVEPFAPAMLNSMQLYMGNWLLFHEFMLQANASGVPLHSSSKMHHHDVDYEEEDFSDFSDIDNLDDMDFSDDQAVDFESFNEYEEDEEQKIMQVEDTDDDAMVNEEDEKPHYGFLAEEEKVVEQKPTQPIVEKVAFKPKEEEKVIPETIEDEKAIPQPEPVIEAAPLEKIVEEKPKVQTTPVEKTVKEEKPKEQIEFYKNRKPDSLIQPIFTEDYFLHQGIPVSEEIPAEADHQNDKEKSLMVVMSFSEWLIHFKTKGEREKEEQQDQKALKTMWQKEKLAAALEEENEEIPENVFEMAVNSITKEDDLASESLAEIMLKQGKYDKAIDMYRKLSLRNPQKSTYFARKIDDIQKEKS